MLALGYRGIDIKNYFLNYYLSQGDLKVDLRVGSAEPLSAPNEDWKITLVETGATTLTAGRLLRLRDHLREEPIFMLTYGDGLSDVDVRALLEFHRSHGRIATMTVVRPPGRFGNVCFKDGRVEQFIEKPDSGEQWINGGFFVFSPRVFDYLGDGSEMLETTPLNNLVKDGQLMAFQHHGFWQCMDTLREKEFLNEIAAKGNPPWLKAPEKKPRSETRKLVGVR